MIPQGKCLKCGERYYGWALKDPKYRICEKCGGEIVLLMEIPTSLPAEVA